MARKLLEVIWQNSALGREFRDWVSWLVAPRALCVGKAMDHELSWGAALLWLLHLLWLLPHSWTAPQGMTVPLLTSILMGLEPKEPNQSF